MKRKNDVNSIANIRARTKSSRDSGPVKYSEMLREMKNRGTGPEDSMTDAEIEFFSRQGKLDL